MSRYCDKIDTCLQAKLRVKYLAAYPRFDYPWSGMSVDSRLSAICKVTFNYLQRCFISSLTRLIGH
jgi:hypothetical protein